MRWKDLSHEVILLICPTERALSPSLPFLSLTVYFPTCMGTVGAWGSVGL